jgi:hypothetical protein
MYKKNNMFYAVVLICLLICTILVSCGRDDFSFAELIESESINDITLTVYYLAYDVRTVRPENVRSLMDEGVHCYKVIVTGEELIEHRDLLMQLANAELIPVEGNFSPNVRIYYFFEHKKYGKIFDCSISIGWTPTFVNDIQVEFNRIFIDAILPFFYDLILRPERLPEYEAERIRNSLDSDDARFAERD